MARYDTPDHDGETRRERNERFGMADETPDVIIPRDGEYILEWLWDISSGRSAGPNGPNPISCTEIAHWQDLTGNRMSRREVAIIRRLDATYLSELAKEREAQDERRRQRTSQYG